MSLWRRNCAFAGLESDRVTLVVRRGTSTLRQESAVFASTGEASPVPSLRALLVDKPLGARRLDVVVSDNYARYLVFDNMSGVRGVAELRMMVAALFEARFGERADDWRIVFDLPPGATAGVACALPRQLLAACLEAAGEAGMKQISIVPFFVAATRACGRRIDGRAWVAARADGQVTLGNIRHGRWESLRTMAATADDEPAILVARERLRLGIEDEGVQAALGLGFWPGGSTPEYSMALAGLTP